MFESSGMNTCHYSTARYIPRTHRRVRLHAWHTKCIWQMECRGYFWSQQLVNQVDRCLVFSGISRGVVNEITGGGETAKISTYVDDDDEGWKICSTDDRKTVHQSQRLALGLVSCQRRRQCCRLAAQVDNRLSNVCWTQQETDGHVQPTSRGFVSTSRSSVCSLSPPLSVSIHRAVRQWRPHHQWRPQK